MRFHPAIAALLLAVATASGARAQEAPAKKAPAEPKKEKTKDGLDATALLAKLALKVDKDGDGALSQAEFRKLPLIKEVKKERIASLFRDLDEDGDGLLAVEEISGGFGKILELAKDETAAVKKSGTPKKEKDKKEKKKKPA